MKKPSKRRPRAKVEIKIGDWFDLPLPSGGHAVGVVSRLNLKAHGAFCYFFGPRRKDPWTEKQVRKLRPQDAVLLARVSVLGFSRGNWVRVASEEEFDPKRWNMPPFLMGMRSPEGGFVPGMLKIRYSDDLTKELGAEDATPSDMCLPEHTDYGYVALEDELDDLV